MSRPAVSQHLRILLDAGLVTEQRHGKRTTTSFLNDSNRSATGSRFHERFWDDRLNTSKDALSKGAKSDENDSKRDSDSPGHCGRSGGRSQSSATLAVDVPE